MHSWHRGHPHSIPRDGRQAHLKPPGNAGLVVVARNQHTTGRMTEQAPCIWKSNQMFAFPQIFYIANIVPTPS